MWGTGAEGAGLLGLILFLMGPILVLGAEPFHQELSFAPGSPICFSYCQTLVRSPVMQGTHFQLLYYSVLPSQHSHDWGIGKRLGSTELSAHLPQA